MKRLALVLALALPMIPCARAQWIEKSYTLASGSTGGWNGIWLAGDASYTTVDKIFAAYPAVAEVWRWNPNPDGAQFSQGTTNPSADNSEWSVWKRDGSETGLSRMIGNSAYLIRTTQPTTVAITQSVLAPVNQWLITGANFFGFPAKPGAVINTYFASFIVNGASGLPTGTKIYSYVGGNFSDTNPMLINTSAASSVKTLDPNTAYWFSIPAVSDFTGAVEYEAPGGSLSYGRGTNTITLGITNRSKAALTLSLSLEASAPSPAGQPAVKAGAIVPLNISTIDPDGTVTLSPVDGASISVPASGRLSVDLALDRSGLTGSSSDLYASILRIRDSASLTDVRLGVSAQPASYAGLWLCDVQVTGVGDNQGHATTIATSRAFPLQFLMHQGSSGSPVLVRQVFLGQLTTGAMGVTTTESHVQASGTSTVEPARFYSPMLPADNTSFPGSGTLGSGKAEWTFTHAYDDSVNPFVHQYHPDHDNRDAKLKPLAAGKEESYSVERTCTFTFSNAPGSTSLSGTYSETLTGLNKDHIAVTGTFTMRRLSEIDTLTP